MYNGNGRLYEFGGFTLNSGSETLWREGELVPVSPKAVKLLLLLVERDGELVTKQEIFDSVWGDTFVTDGVLTQNIYTLRNKLGTGADGRQLIETVPRRGYRFSGRVTSKSADSASQAPLVAVKPGRPPAGPVPAAGSDTPNSRLTGNFLVVFAVLVVLGLSAAAVYIWTFRDNIGADVSIGTVAAPIEQLRLQPITDSGDVIYPTISPNGEILAYIRHGDTDTSVWIRQIATGSSVQVLPPSEKGYRSLAFAPDGSYIYFREQEDSGPLYRVAVLGGAPVRVLPTVSGDFAVSPDGSAIAFVRSDRSRSVESLVVASLDGGSEREIISTPPARGLTGLPAWSPTGKEIAIGKRADDGNSIGLVAVDVELGTETSLQTRPWRNIAAILWMPEGDSLVFSARAADEPKPQLWIFNTKNKSVRRLTNDLEGYFWLSRSADGKVLVTRQQRIDARVWLADEGIAADARAITDGGRSLDGYSGLTIGPDGRIVYTVRSDNANDLFTIGGGRSEALRLTSDSGQENTRPQFTPDGRYLIFSSDRSGTRQIWRMDAEGGGQQQLTPDEEGRTSSDWPAVPHTGSDVYFIRRNGERASVWKIPVSGGETSPVYAPDSSLSGPLSVSPNAKWLAVSVSANGGNSASRVTVVPVDGAADARFFDIEMRRPVIRWFSDSEFDYAAGPGDASVIMRQNINGAPPVKVMEFPDRVYNFAWSRDGRDLVVSRGALRGDAILITNLR